MNLDELPKTFQAACAYLARPLLARMNIKYDMSEVCKTLEIEHHSMLSSSRKCVKLLFSKKSNEEYKKYIALQMKLNEQSFAKNIYEYKSNNPDCWTKDERHQMTSEFKDFLILQKVEFNLSWEDINLLLGIPIDTLKKLKRQKSDNTNEDKNDDDDNGSTLLEIPDHIIWKLRQFFKTRESKATVKDFIDKNPDVLVEMKLDYRQFSSLLIRLGFVSPRGIFLNNTGLDVIKRFIPNAVWGTDGKNINIEINGVMHRWVWQCLIDYKTTILVGGVITKSETTDNLLEAILQARETFGISPMAIVLDNRLSENLPAVKKYLDEMGIEIIKTFPGNSKSNGIIENNFRVFEKWVHGNDGVIKINANTPESLSLSIAKLLTEVFTQLRGHAPRASLNGKSSSEVAKDNIPISNEEYQRIKDEIKALANRFKNENSKPITSESKEQALSLAIELVKPRDLELFKKRLSASVFTAELILQAIGIFKTQVQKYPEKIFDHAYFGGILRNLADQQSLEWLQLNLESTHNEFFKKINLDLIKVATSAQSLTESCEKLIEECINGKIPATTTFAFVYLKNILISIGSKSLSDLKNIIDLLIKKVLKLKLVQIKKREVIIQKLYSFETFVKTMVISSEKIIKKTTQVFSTDAEVLLTT
jgi:hypothetical protein